MASEQTSENQFDKIRSYGSKQGFPTPPTFTSKTEEREYLKFKLAQAFRIFGATIPQ